MTDIIRKMLLTVSSALLALGLVVTGADAQTSSVYPNKPVTVVVPFPPGGSSDTFARFIGEELQKRWGQPVVVENKPGALGTVGTQAVAKSRADGYTLLLGASYLATAPSLQPSLAYSPSKDLMPIGVGIEMPLALYASKSLNVTSLNDLIALLKAKPDAYNFASAGNGTLAHIQAEIFQRETGTSLIHIPYQGSAPAMIDIIAGRAQLIVDSVAVGAPYVKAGQIVPLLVTQKSNDEGFTAVPTVAEAGLPQLNLEPWNVFFAPAGTDKSIIDELSTHLTAVLSSPVASDWLKRHAASAILSNSAAFTRRLSEETSQLADIIGSADIRAN